MNIYRLRFSVRTSVTTVHADLCSSAAFGHRYSPRPRKDTGLLLGTHDCGDSVWQVHAESAQAAAEEQEAEFKADQRSMPKVKVCGCCKGM